MANEPVMMVLIDMTETVPGGDAQLIVRLSQDDREIIDLGATVIQMKQADFMRTALVAVAKKLISENAR